VAERQRLVEELQTAQRRLQEQNQAMVQQELRVNADLETAAALESRLQKESADRQSLQQELQAARRAATVESEKRQIESSKHQADLHNELVERRRLETNVVRLRHATIKAARAGRIVRQKLRQQTNQPVEALLHSLRNLMASEFSLDQKDRLEEMLEQVLLLKASIQEPRLRAAGGNNGGCNQ
jgi:hypothetical protein